MDSNNCNKALAGPADAAMGLIELQASIDAEILADTVQDLLSLAPGKRAAAIEDFAAVDPLLGSKLRAAMAFAVS